MSTIQQQNRLSQLIAAGEELTSSGIPVLPIRPRAKAPIPHPTDGSWWTIDDPDDVAPVFGVHPDANLAMLCGRGKGSPVLVVDIDGPSGLAKVRELGVNSAADCWCQRTGSGNWQITYYADDGLEIHRRVKPQGVDLDLVVDGYALVPPSTTKGPYRWQPGHGPSEIPLSDLASPPTALVEWSQEVQDKGSPQQTNGGNSAYTLLGAPIPNGSRNDTLCRIAGWLRLYHPEPVVLALLSCVNESRCFPPLPQEEVGEIVKSVFRYSQTGVNGHPRAVVPTFQREASSDA